MNCLDAREGFSGWVDETLTAEEHAALAAHLAGCAECQRELGRFRGTVALLERVERPRAPAGFAARVLEALRPIPWHRRLVARLFLPLSVKLPAEAAALLLVAGLAVYIFQGTPALQQAAHQEVSRPAAPAVVPAVPPPPPAAVAPPESRPSPLAEVRRKAESTPKSQGASGARSGQLVPAKESGETAAAPPPPPAAAPSSPPAAPVTPAPVTEAQKDRGAAETPIARAPEPQRAEAPSRVSPAVEERRDSATKKTTRTPAQAPLAPRGAMSALPAADVAGRLAVTDRGAAESALVELITRAGGTLVSRRAESDATVMDLIVPRARYPEFAQGLGRIGTWLPQGEPALLPPDVRVTLRVAE
jgi:putative zinc finger protein